MHTFFTYYIRNQATGYVLCRIFELVSKNMTKYISYIIPILLLLFLLLLLLMITVTSLMSSFCWWFQTPTRNISLYSMLVIF